MPRKAAIGVCFVCAVALCATIASAAQAANTWEGVWNTDFGRMTLSASGSGSYEGFSPGTVSGPANGDVNEGTWNQPGDPPRSGPYRFVLSGGGQSFTGEWQYEQGGCGSACGWNGTCIEGACLENGVTGGGGGDGDGGSCQAPFGGSRLFSAARADSCPGERVKFRFEIKKGFPATPDRADLPEHLIDMEVRSAGYLETSPDSDDFSAHGDILIETHYDEPGLGKYREFVHLSLDDSAGTPLYVTKPNKPDYRKVLFGGRVKRDGTSEADCKRDAPPFNAGLAVDGRRAAFKIKIGDCLSDKSIGWKLGSFEQASIKPPSDLLDPAGLRHSPHRLPDSFLPRGELDADGAQAVAGSGPGWLRRESRARTVGRSRPLRVSATLGVPSALTRRTRVLFGHISPITIAATMTIERRERR